MAAKGRQRTQRVERLGRGGPQQRSDDRGRLPPVVAAEHGPRIRRESSLGHEPVEEAVHTPRTGDHMPERHAWGELTQPGLHRRLRQGLGQRLGLHELLELPQHRADRTLRALAPEGEGLHVAVDERVITRIPDHHDGSSLAGSTSSPTSRRSSVASLR